MKEVGETSAGVPADAVWDTARRIGALPGLNIEQRRQRFLRGLRETLGPVQFQHLTAHCEEVSRTAVRLAHLMGLPPEQVEVIRQAGLLHDLGKALIPDDLLAKPGPLSPAEREALGHHADQGARLCEALGARAGVVDAVRHHHTRHDAGDAPITAAVVCVADALAAMTSDRPYSAARSYSEALAELRQGRGTQFEPHAVVAAHILGAGAMARAAA
jgi:putative nucleotidyltransferase with HDIG domain